MTRPSWDEYFMAITRVVAERSTCRRRRVGAIIVSDRRILTTGYNGAPTGLRHCLDIGCLREERGIASGERHELCRGLHAEQNAIIQAAHSGVSVRGATLYTTHFPCVLCAKMIINALVVRVVFGADYPDGLSQELLKEAGLGVEADVGAVVPKGGAEVDS
ncbi:MAG: cytidine/deoxycytidylate deaminase family protein [Peptococcaceae bacterium]|nr:cytidine/deoxycytidylate deaminase family protein [Peptococcaceae bacterium]